MRTFVQVVRHQLDGDRVDHVQAGGTFLQLGLQQVIGEVRRAPFPADRRALVIQHLAVQERFFADLDIVGVGIEIDGPRIVTHQQRADDRLAQVRGRIGGGDGLDGNGAGVEVDVAAGLVLVGIFDVVFRPGDQNFVQTPRCSRCCGRIGPSECRSRWYL